MASVDKRNTRGRGPRSSLFTNNLRPTPPNPLHSPQRPLPLCPNPSEEPVLAAVDDGYLYTDAKETGTSKKYCLKRGLTILAKKTP